MTIHAPLRPTAASTTPERLRMARLERELDEASALLHRLLGAEDRIGLAFGVMDDARRFLARRRPGLA